MSKFLKTAGAIAVFALVVILAGVSITAAQDTVEPTAVPETSTVEQAPPFWGRGGRGQGMMGQGPLAVEQDAMHAAIADALGLTVEELDAAIADGKDLVDLAAEQGVDFAAVRDAMEAVHAEALAQAVEDGLITQEQADLMNQRGMNGPADGFGGRRGGFGGQRGGMMGGFGAGPMAVDQAEMHTAIAGALGISVEEFEAAVDEGQTLVDIAEAQGVDLADVQAAMDEIHAAALEQAVADGLITQEQADWMNEHRSERVLGQGFGPGNGPCHGDADGSFGGARGGMGRGMGGNSGGGARGGSFGGGMGRGFSSGPQG